jgi:hypothetical protein
MDLHLKWLPYLWRLLLRMHGVGHEAVGLASRTRLLLPLPRIVSAGAALAHVVQMMEVLLSIYWTWVVEQS